MKRRAALKLAALAPLAPLAACATQRQAEMEQEAPAPSPTPSQTPAEVTSVAPEVTTRASENLLDPQHNLQEPTTFGMHMPGIVDTVPATPGTRTIALTFDACNGEYDAALIATLRQYRVPATLFLAQPWIEAHPQIARELIADPLFLVANHGTRHLPLTVRGQAAYGIHGTASPAEAIAEIEGNARLLRDLGADPTWFRAGTAHYDDVAVRMANDAGYKIGGFTVNGDFGATSTPELVANQIMTAPDGAIVLAHMNHPHSGTAAGVAHALEVMRGERFVLIDARVP